MPINYAPPAEVGNFSGFRETDFQMVDIIRKARNKESARQSRRRKAVYLELLEAKVASLLKSPLNASLIVTEDRILSSLPTQVREMLTPAIIHLKQTGNPRGLGMSLDSSSLSFPEEALRLATKIKALVDLHDEIQAELYSFSHKSDITTLLEGPIF